MAMKWLRFLFFAVIAGLLFYSLNFRHGLLPPMGKLANPFAGFWQNGESLDDPPAFGDVAGLQDSVIVLWDDRRVPHIFARNDHDLYYAQGYITASQRLWEMEMQIFGAAGRLSEVFGPRTLGYDRMQRRVGVLAAAQKTFEHMIANPQAREVVEAYSDGVNAYIATLDTKHLPLEYKLLNYQPEAWQPVNSAILLKMMAWDLTAYKISEKNLTRVREILGEAAVDSLYPIDPPFTEPIIPASTKWDFTPLKATPPATSDPGIGVDRFRDTSDPPQNLGSNNWAVSGSKTKSGDPMLCNDPHLGLTLPSIWFEIQLISPGVNVYGVTLPGAPAVVIGFNDSIAWGITNAETDVLDWYDIQFRDSTGSEYRFAGGWRPSTIRIDTIGVYGGDAIIDTTILTHQGPVVYERGMTPADPDVPVGAAMRWAGAEPSDELLAILDLNCAKNYEDCITALQDYSCPAQNFAFACADGDIAICQEGLFPVRWPGQGRFVMDGSDSLNDWQGWIPREQLPQIRNPERGFVSSANQRPVDPSYPYYLDGNYAPYSRSARIDELLQEKDGLDTRDMMRIQTDVLSPDARKLAPVILPLVDTTRFDSTQTYCFDMLSNWDFRYVPESQAATIYEYWWGEMSMMIWQDEFPADDTDIRYPRQDVTEKIILTEPNSPYVDDHTTPKHETLADILNSSFAEAVKSLVAARGGPSSDWEWGKVKPLNIRHLAQIPGLGRDDLPSGGWWSTVDAVVGNTGPSWRMIVQTSDSVRAWGVYPGGQSGNPGSSFYDDGVDLWLAGGYRPLLYLETAAEKNDRIVQKTTIRGVQ